MGILNLTALPFFSVLGILILIYLRERMRKRIEVPSLLFWETIAEDRIRARRFCPTCSSFSRQPCCSCWSAASCIPIGHEQ